MAETRKNTNETQKNTNKKGKPEERLLAIQKKSRNLSWMTVKKWTLGFMGL